MNDTEDQEQLQIASVTRPQAMSRYRLLSCLMFCCGFALIFFAVYVADMFHGTGYGLPYYVGALISGIPVMVLSLVGGTVYYKGQHIGKASYITHLLILRVRPLMLCFIIMAPIVSVVCFVGLLLTGIYGFCTGDECSYASNTSINLGMAAFLFCVELISLGLTLTSIVMAVYYGRYFGVKLKLPRRKIHGTISVKPHEDKVKEAVQMYTLQKWKMKTDSIHMLIDFRKIREYQENARRLREIQNGHM